MLTRDNGEVGSESEEMPPLVDRSDEEIAYPVEGEALVISRALNIQIKEDDVDQQWENIFHTRCHIQNKVCSMIIDGGSDANLMITWSRNPHAKTPIPGKPSKSGLIGV
jgi:hypothetical protein